MNDSNFQCTNSVSNMGNIVMTKEQIHAVRLDLELIGNTQLINDDGNRYIVIEKNILTECDKTVYFAFKFVYNKTNVYVCEFENEDEMLLFYEKSLKRGFQRKPCEMTNYYPKWLSQVRTQIDMKCQLEYKNRILNRHNNHHYGLFSNVVY